MNDFLIKWQKFPLSLQLANIGSEFSRAVSLQQKKDKENMERSAVRALELIDMTIAQKQSKDHLHEILRLREVICDFLFNDGAEYHTKADWLKNYFLFFALKRHE